MIRFLFTIDYEIYGNGTGSLRELVHAPAARLKELFDRHHVKFVTFVEAAEFEQIARYRTDEAIADVERQIRDLHRDGFELGLHLHPQWARASHSEQGWQLDYDEYNLCTLGQVRIREIVDRTLAYLRGIIGDPAWAPLSFRAGNWLFQPTRDAAEVLASSGIQIDSSVFKGGIVRQFQLDYRAARRNGWSWKFSSDVNQEDRNGPMTEYPIYTEMVPFWRMLTAKRVGLQRKGRHGSPTKRGAPRRWRDYLRPFHPLKLDFCRMSLGEMTRMLENVCREEKRSPGLAKDIVSIGHTKDLIDLDAIDAFLSWLACQGIPVVTFQDIARPASHPR